MAPSDNSKLTAWRSARRGIRIQLELLAPNKKPGTTHGGADALPAAGR
jgi:hypothetical protein